MIKPRIVLLSDLWGFEKSEWMEYYINNLENHFDVTVYDSCELAEITVFDDLGNTRHHQFINGGIDKALWKILLLEKLPVIVLAFSIGGTIAWKAALAGLQAQHLFAVSSTRLRYETNKPTSKTDLFYGEADEYKPTLEWFEEMNITPNFFSKEGHGMYRKQEVAEKICRQIKERLSNDC